MNKYSIYILSTFIGVFIFTATVAMATTGGPILIHDLRHDASLNTLYFQSISQDGRGCPPELKTLSIGSGQYSTVFSCEDAEKFAAIDKDYTYGSYNQKILSFTEKLGYAKLINLKTNKVSIETHVEKVKPCTLERPWECGVDFIATVTQDGVKKADIPYSTCSLEEPLFVDGYSIGGGAGKIVLMFSRVGLCVEGGYVLETLHTVSDINIIDSSVVNYYKQPTALVPHIGSLFIIPGENNKEMAQPISENIEKAQSGTTPNNVEDDFNKYIIYIVFGTFLLGFGVILGKFVKG